MKLSIFVLSQHKAPQTSISIIAAMILTHSGLMAPKTSTARTWKCSLAECVAWTRVEFSVFKCVGGTKGERWRLKCGCSVSLNVQPPARKPTGGCLTVAWLFSILTCLVFLQPTSADPPGQTIKCRFLMLARWPPFRNKKLRSASFFCIYSFFAYT